MVNVTTIDVQELLTRSVRIATGIDDAEPRPGQLDLALDIDIAFRFSAPMLGVAPTGTGKSFAHLCAAAARWLERGDRTIVSTESIALQSQFVDKDLPVVAQAVMELTGKELTFGLLKGTSNYVDPLQLAASSMELTNGATSSARTASKKLRSNSTPPPRGMDAGDLASLLEWSSDAVDGRNTGDRAEYAGYADNEMWGLVSSDTSSSGDCPVSRAKERAGAAAIVVTNHAILGIQASGGARLIHGSKKLGVFRNIIVDEAHALPSAVRSQGATRISAGQLRGLLKVLNKVVDVSWIKDDVDSLAERLNTDIGKFLGSQNDKGISDSETPLSDSLIEDIKQLLSGARSAATSAEPMAPAGVIARQRSLARIERIGAALASVTSGHAGSAAWAERDSMGVSVRVSPVNVGPSIRANVLSNSEEELGAAIVSATLPAGFGYEVGVRAEIGQYESPFRQAYDESAAFVPLCEDMGEAGLLSSRYGKKKFDTELHPVYCTDKIVELVGANCGSALILAATKKAGMEYAEALRRDGGGWRVYSQWDGGDVKHIVKRWKGEPSSVLVGTKSLMTGVDAPGETCSLVIIDRVPRARKNYVDDARVAVRVDDGAKRWDADAKVYGADAAMLLEQAIGRLIRGMGDRGMVAVLDPRINPKSDGSYNGTTRMMYAQPFIKFGSRFGQLDDALEWIRERNEPLGVPLGAVESA